MVFNKLLTSKRLEGEQIKYSFITDKLSQMNDSASKIFLGVIAVSTTLVFIGLFPLTRQALSWNRCLKRTTETLNKVKAVQSVDEDGKKVLSVMICNGAVFEPKFKTITKQSQ